MKRFVEVNLSLILLLLFVVGTAEAKKLDIRRLLQKSAFYDNKVVEIEAEAVGLLRRKDGVWLNVSDGFSLGVWVRGDKKIVLPTRFAGYYQEGDWLYIKGIFHAACRQHRGETDIHAEQIKLIRRGRKKTENVSSDKKSFAAIMLAIFLVCAMFFSYRQKLWKKKS